MKLLIGKNKDALMTDKFTFFWRGEFSQWYPSEFSYGGHDFVNCEQFMMFCKADLFNDVEIGAKILAEPNPRKIKDLGREVRNFDQAKWDRYDYAFVQMGNYLKFNYHKELLELLFSTGETLLVEASPHDSKWGIGMGVEDPNIENPAFWQGHNLLGRVLTDVSEVLKFRTQNKNRLYI